MIAIVGRQPKSGRTHHIQTWLAGGLVAGLFMLPGLAVIHDLASTRVLRNHAMASVYPGSQLVLDPVGPDPFLIANLSLGQPFPSTQLPLGTPLYPLVLMPTSLSGHCRTDVVPSSISFSVQDLMQQGLHVQVLGQARIPTRRWLLSGVFPNQPVEAGCMVVGLMSQRDMAMLAAVVQNAPPVIERARHAAAVAEAKQADIESRQFLQNQREAASALKAEQR